MSNNQSAVGEFFIPSKDRAKVRRALLNIHAQSQKRDYETLMRLYEDFKSFRPLRKRADYIFNKRESLPQRDSDLSYRLTDREGKLVRPKKADFKAIPQLNKDGSRLVSLDSSYGFCISKDCASVYFYVRENNHNVDDALGDTRFTHAMTVVSSLESHNARSGGCLVIDDEYAGRGTESVCGGVGDRMRDRINKHNFHAVSMDDLEF